MTLDAFIRRMPKLELHAHIGGSVREQTILELINEKKETDVTLDQVTLTPWNMGKRTMEQCFELFSVIHRLCDDLDTVCRITEEALQDFVADGARYVELRSTPRAMERTGTSERDYVAAVINSMDRFQHEKQQQEKEEEGSQDSGPNSGGLVGCGLLLSINRSQSLEKARQTVQLAAEFRNRGVCGLDFSGNCYVGPFGEFQSIFEYARRQYGLPITLHFGETMNGADSEAILNFAPERVGHASVLSNDLQERLIALGTPIECW